MMKINLEQARVLLARAVATQGSDFVYRPSASDDGICFYVPVTDELLATVRERSNEVWHSRLDQLSADAPCRQTGCLIGVALDLAGLTLHHSLVNTTIQAAQPLIGNANISNIQGIDDVLEPDAIRYFREAQWSQDGGDSWGVAYAKAEASLTAQ